MGLAQLRKEAVERRVRTLKHSGFSPEIRCKAGTRDNHSLMEEL